jgi:serine/threonine-protein kinase
MAEAPPNTDPRLAEERLAHALVSRGLLTPDEAERARANGGPVGPAALLGRLVAANLLAPGQARRATQELASLLGQQIPGYLLLEKIGHGSMGVVYRASQLSMDRMVAVKVLRPRLAADPHFLERLRREAHLAARLSHNNIVQAIDVGSAGAMHYFIMEYVEGKTVKQELDAGKIYGEKEALEIVVQIAQALAHAGKRGLVHRDVKPANIVTTDDGIAKLADLGMAREADDLALARRERGLVMGTPYYAAPEQIQCRDDVDVRADLYALGATLYHMTTGRPPFPHNDVVEVLDAHLTEELTPPARVNPALSAGLGEVIAFLMAKDREDRYRVPEDLINDVESLLNDEPPKLALRRSAATPPRRTEDPTEDAPAGASLPWLIVAVLAGLLGASVLANLALLLR